MRRGIDPVRVQLMVKPSAPRYMKVGRGKHVEQTPKGTEFRMYDQPIVTLKGKEVILDLCGYWTGGVVKAMREFTEAIGYDIKPSIAKGRFTAQYRGTIHEADYRNQIHIQVQ